MLSKLLNKVVTFVIIYVTEDCVTPLESVKCLSKIFSCLLADGSLLFAHKKKRILDTFQTPMCWPIFLQIVEIDFILYTIFIVCVRERNVNVIDLCPINNTEMFTK